MDDKHIKLLNKTTREFNSKIVHCFGRTFMVLSIIFYYFKNSNFKEMRKCTINKKKLFYLSLKYGRPTKNASSMKTNH